MAQSLLAMTKDLVLAQIQAGHVSPDALTEALQTTYRTLRQLQALEAGEARLTEPTPPAREARLPWQRSITTHTVTCLECGAAFRQLSSRHLRRHGLDGRTYRAKYGIPRTQALVARTSLARRRKVIQRSRPWEQARNRRTPQSAC